MIDSSINANRISSLVDLWLASGDTVGDAETLLWFTRNGSVHTAHNERLVGKFNIVAVQLVKEASQTTMRTAKDINQRMAALCDENGWTGLVIPDRTAPSPVATKDPVDNARSQPQSASKEGHVSTLDFDLKKERTLAFIAAAGPNDKAKIEELLAEVDSLMAISSLRGSNDGTSSSSLEGTGLADWPAKVSEAMFDYGIRTNDGKEALRWIRVFENTKPTPPATVLVDKLTKLIDVWQGTESPDTPWRVSEIVRRIEGLDAQNGLNSLDTDSYNMLCRLWSESSDSSAGQKLIEVVKRMTALGSTDETVAPNETTFEMLLTTLPKLNDKKVTAHTASLLAANWERLDPTKLSGIVDRLMAVLADMGLHLQATTLMELSTKTGIAVHKSMPKNVLEAHKSAEPKKVVAELDKMTKNDAFKGGVDFSTYASAMRALVASNRKDSFQEETGLMMKICDDVLTRRTRVSGRDFSIFLRETVHKLGEQGRFSEADEMVRLLESSIIFNNNDAARKAGIRVPIACFKYTMAGWKRAEKYDRVEAVYGRMVNHKRNGHHYLTPDKSILAICLSCLASSKGRGPSTAQRAEDMLRSFIEWHSNGQETNGQKNQGNGRNTNNNNGVVKDASDIDAGHFNSILICWKHSESPEALPRSLELLNQMDTLGIRYEPFTIETAMEIALKRSDPDVYKTVLALRDRLKKARLQPTVFVHGLILRACAKAPTSAKEQAVKLAMETVGRLRASKSANFTQYESLVDALTTLLRGDKRLEQLIAGVAWHALQEGKLDKDLRDRFVAVLGPKEWKRLRMDHANQFEKGSA